jgi:ferredoxin-NADP reductase
MKPAPCWMDENPVLASYPKKTHAGRRRGCRWSCRSRPAATMFFSQPGLASLSGSKTALCGMRQLSKASWVAVGFVLHYGSATGCSGRGAGAAARMATLGAEEPVKVTAIETIRVAEFPNLLWVEVLTDEGVKGLGETFYGPAAAEGHIHGIIAPYLIGKDPRNIEAHQLHLTGYIGFTGASAEMRGRSAIDIALWDILGQSVGLPLCDLLGGRVREEIVVFIEALEPLQPRLYSISSSPRARPSLVSLTVDMVRYEIAGRQRSGVASSYLCERAGLRSELKVYIQRAHGFGLPATSDTPIIMVGPGTGIAPFRAFLHERALSPSSGRAWLFFGHQHEATDFFYREELEQFLQAGTLSKLSTAWSRDGARKVYVQDRMRQAGSELWAWLQDGAHFYVCGDALRMAKDVETALLEIATKEGGMNGQAAKAFIAQLKGSGRYQADVY